MPPTGRRRLRRPRPLGSLPVAVLVILGVLPSGIGSHSTTPTASIPGPPTVSASAAPTGGAIPLGVAFSATGSSGSPPYTFVWTFGDGPGTATGDAASHTYTFWGVFQANVTLTDSLGDSARASVNITVTPAPLVVVAHPSVPSVAVGGMVTLQTSVTGGARPFTYAWYGLPPGCPTIGAENLTCQVTTGGEYNVTVVVTDSLGTVTSASFPFLVTGGTPPVAAPDDSQGTIFLELIAGLALVAAIAGLLVGLWWRRRRSKT